MDFYYINHNYVNFLRTFEPKVPLLDYEPHEKFVCGVIFEIEGIKYYSPVSHYASPDQTSFAIKDKKEKTIASIRNCFMFPVPDDLITRLNFRDLTIIDRAYADLVRIEYNFCKKHEDKIKKHAKKTHKDGCNRSLYIAQFINDFKKLEENYLSYDPTVTYPTAVKES